MSVDRIAYTGSDGELFTIKPDGTDSKRLAGGNTPPSARHIPAQVAPGASLYSWPTWSPSGNSIATSRVSQLSQELQVSIEVFDTASAQSVEVYENEPQVFPLIADDAPHYLYWSPDDRYLTFIAATTSGLTLFAALPDGQAPAKPLATQGPIYFSWAQDSSSILMHRGQDLLLARAPFVQSYEEITRLDANFRAPAYSPTSSQAVYMGRATGGDALYLVDTQQDTPARELVEVVNSTSFLWSPSGEEIAVADSPSPSQPFYHRLRIVRADGSGTREVFQEPFISFFWSPNTESILYATVASSEQALLWKVVSSAGGPPRELLEFIPSGELSTLLTFSDQYAYSHSLWSPDSTRFVFAGVLRQSPTGTNGQTPTSSKVYVVDVESGTPREIASGRMALWSWN